MNNTALFDIVNRDDGQRFALRAPPMSRARVPGERSETGPRGDTADRLNDLALRDSCAGSRVSFRSRKSARYTRPGHETDARGPQTGLMLRDAPCARSLY